MKQHKHIVIAFFILVFVGSVIFFAVNKYQSNRPDTANNFRVITDHTDVPDSSVQAGKALYMSYCVSCHGRFEYTDGPNMTLAGLSNRWPDQNELFAFIRNPEDIMKTNNYARKLRKQYQTIMTGFPDLNDKKIQSIMDYIEFKLGDRY